MQRAGEVGGGLHVHWPRASIFLNPVHINGAIRHRFYNHRTICSPSLEIHQSARCDLVRQLQNTNKKRKVEILPNSETPALRI